MDIFLDPFNWDLQLELYCNSDESYTRVSVHLRLDMGSGDYENLRLTFLINSDVLKTNLLKYGEYIINLNSRCQFEILKIYDNEISI